jgi:hypothetical protein
MSQGELANCVSNSYPGSTSLQLEQQIKVRPDHGAGF